MTILNNHHLDLNAVAKDLGLNPCFTTDRAITIAHGLIDRLKYSVDPQVYYVPINGRGHYKVILPDVGFPRCSCPDWQAKHKEMFGFHQPYRNWICPHGAAVLLSLGRSTTFCDFLSLPDTVEVKPEESDNNLDLRRFFAAFGKENKQAWTKVGIDKGMAQEAMRRHYKVVSLTELEQKEWAMLAAMYQAATKSQVLMDLRAAEIKVLLSEDETP